MKNCAAVSFSLVEGTIDGGTHFTITEDSFCEIFEGFKGKKMAPPRKLSEMSRNSSSHLLRESTPRKSSFNSDKPFYEGELGKKARKSLIKEMPRWQTRVFQIQKEQGFYVLKYYSDKGSAAAKKGAKTLLIEFKEIKEFDFEGGSGADPVGAGWGMDDLDSMLLKGMKKKRQQCAPAARRPRPCPDRPARLEPCPPAPPPGAAKLSKLALSRLALRPGAPPLPWL